MGDTGPIMERQGRIGRFNLRMKNCPDQGDGLAIMAESFKE
jgi:hypothetical protein